MLLKCVGKIGQRLTLHETLEWPEHLLEHKAAAGLLERKQESREREAKGNETKWKSENRKKLTDAGVEPAISWFVVKRLTIGPAGRLLIIAVIFDIMDQMSVCNFMPCICLSLADGWSRCTCLVSVPAGGGYVSYSNPAVGGGFMQYGPDLGLCDCIWRDRDQVLLRNEVLG